MKITEDQRQIIEPLAWRWFAFENQDDNGTSYGYGRRFDLKNMSPGDVKAIAVPRIALVFSGEVRYSDTSPGDKAVWWYKPRNMDPWLGGVPVREPQWWYAFTSGVKVCESCLAPGCQCYLNYLGDALLPDRIVV